MFQIFISKMFGTLICMMYFYLFIYFCTGQCWFQK